MDPSNFDQLSKSWALRNSRRALLLGLGGGILAGVSSVVNRGSPATGKIGVPPVGTPTSYPTFDPILPTLNPIPIGDDTYIINGQSVYIDPGVAANLTERGPVPITVDEEIVFVDLDGFTTIPATPGDPSLASPEPPTFATPSPALSETSCGDGLQDVESFPGSPEVTREFVLASQRAVGLLRWNTYDELLARYNDPGDLSSKRWCSGTLIADDLFLTAGHCFDQFPDGRRVPRINGTDTPIPRAEIATNMRAIFGYQVTPGGEELDGEGFPAVELVEDSLGEYDFAILRLSGKPGVTHGIARVGLADSPVGSTICIIGHPNGWPKQIEAGHVLDYADYRILYNDISTDPGSSGSGILWSPDGPIVGVHTTGGCSPDRRDHNYGVRISTLLTVSPTLEERSRLPLG